MGRERWEGCRAPEQCVREGTMYVGGAVGQASLLGWTSKPGVCSEEAGLSLPLRNRCPFDAEKKGGCTG